LCVFRAPLQEGADDICVNDLEAPAFSKLPELLGLSEAEGGRRGRGKR
jgi:hypothetical protein